MIPKNYEFLYCDMFNTELQSWIKYSSNVLSKPKKPQLHTVKGNLFVVVIFSLSLMQSEQTSLADSGAMGESQLPILSPHNKWGISLQPSLYAMD